MFANEKNIDTLQELFAEVKKYAGLQADYLSLQLVQKLTVLLSTLILVLVLVILGCMALFYLSFTLAYVMAPAVGGLKVSYALISAFILLLIAAIAFFRQPLIVRPMVRFLAGLFLSDDATPMAQQEQAKKEEIEQSRQRMALEAQSLMEREPARPGVQGFVHHLQTGMAIYDGVRTGLMIMRRVQSLLGGRRRHRK
jgi:hypothetical protein